MRGAVIVLLICGTLWAGPAAAQVGELGPGGFLADQSTAGVPVGVCGPNWSTGYMIVVTGAGPGQPPTVRVWWLGASAFELLAAWNAYAPSFTGGVWVACHYVSPYVFITTGAGPSGGAHVRLWQFYRP